MAVGIIIGAAFGTIVKSLVSDVIMPPIGLLFGGVDFSNLFFVIREGTVAGPFDTLQQAQEAVTVNYGAFFNTVISFLIVAWAIFILIKGINKMKKKEAEVPAEATTKECPYCFNTISIKATRCPACTSSLT